MSKYISVPTAWAVYQVPDETFSLLVGGMASNPPQIVLELMVLQGHAKRVAKIGDFSMEEESGDGNAYSDDEDDDETGEPAPGLGPWYSGAIDGEDDDKSIDVT